MKCVFKHNQFPDFVLKTIFVILLRVLLQKQLLHQLKYADAEMVLQGRSTWIKDILLPAVCTNAYFGICGT